MKIKASALFCCILIIIGFLAGAAPVTAEQLGTSDEAYGLIEGVIEYNKKKTGADTVREWLDGELASCAGVTSEWYVISLRQYDKTLDFTSYVSALKEYINNNRIAGAVTRQRLALALIACGQKDYPFVKATLEDSIGKQGVMSWIFGLHLLNNGAVSAEYGASDIINKLLTLRKNDGGWALSGDYSDIDVTAMAIQALAPYYREYADIKTAVDTALNLLGKKQLEDGGYKSFGESNPESASQVMTALCSVGIDPLNDARFIKNGYTLLDAVLGYKLSDGSFCHTEGGASDITATVQAFCSFVSLYRTRSGEGPLYLFDPDTTVPPYETASPSESTAPPPSYETTAPLNDNDNTNGSISYKPWACLAVAVSMLIACVILWLCKKRSPKNFVFVLILGVLAVCFILFTNFQGADDYYKDGTEKKNAIGTVTLTIRCDTVVGKSDSRYIPADGIILPETEFKIESGDSAFDILTEAAKKYRIQMESEGNMPDANDLAYISGINYLYEFDFGELSGWVYHVNGITPSVGCGSYTLSDGDKIEFLYSCNLGEDVK